MRIAVCIKQVPDTEARLRVRADGSWIEEDDLPFVINESDEYALEEGIALAEKTGAQSQMVPASLQDLNENREQTPPPPPAPKQNGDNHKDSAGSGKPDNNGHKNR